MRRASPTSLPCRKGGGPRQRWRDCCRAAANRMSRRSEAAITGRRGAVPYAYPQSLPCRKGGGPRQRWRDCCRMAANGTSGRRPLRGGSKAPPYAYPKSLPCRKGGGPRQRWRDCCRAAASGASRRSEAAITGRRGAVPYAAGPRPRPTHIPKASLAEREGDRVSGGGIVAAQRQTGCRGVAKRR